MTADTFYDLDEIEWACFDIETTGFKSADDDIITTIIMHHSGVYHIWLNLDGDSITSEQALDIQKTVVQESGIENICLHICEDGDSTFVNFQDYLDTHAGNNTVVAAFNGETWRGDTDFDIPFMRTRCFRLGVPWVLDGFWYSDIYEVFSQKSRFDTTVQDTPSLDGMVKEDLRSFAEELGVDTGPDNKLLKNPHAREVDKIPAEVLKSWTIEESDFSIETKNPNTPSDYSKPQLQSFCDYRNERDKETIEDELNISLDNDINVYYKTRKKDEIIQDIISNEGYEGRDMLIRWHKETGLSIGTREATTLDGIHEVVIEDRIDSSEWRNNLPVELEVFELCDPFESSGEAVTQYLEGNYSDVILHCLVDVAKTVNLARMVEEYVPKKDYKPKIL